MPTVRVGKLGFEPRTFWLAVKSPYYHNILPCLISNYQNHYWSTYHVFQLHNDDKKNKRPMAVLTLTPTAATCVLISQRSKVKQKRQLEANKTG